MKYKLAVFDLDGTILDTLEDLTDSLNYVLKKSGYPERTIQEVRSFVGNGIRKLIERGVPAGTPSGSIDIVHKEFVAYYKVHCNDKTKPYDGITELLDKLKASGCLTAVVSNKADFAVKELCKIYFDGMFDIVIGEQPNIAVKPSPDSVNKVLELLDISPCDAVYIGDSEVDIQTAANAGIDCISVDWGFKDRDFLLMHGAELIISRVCDIADIIMTDIYR